MRPAKLLQPSSPFNFRSQTDTTRTLFEEPTMSQGAVTNNNNFSLLATEIYKKIIQNVYGRLPGRPKPVCAGRL